MIDLLDVILILQCIDQPKETSRSLDRQRDCGFRREGEFRLFHLEAGRHQSVFDFKKARRFGRDRDQPVLRLDVVRSGFQRRFDDRVLIGTRCVDQDDAFVGESE